MRLEGLNQAIEGFQHESLKTPGTSFDQLMTSAWRLPVMPLIEVQPSYRYMYINNQIRTLPRRFS